MHTWTVMIGYYSNSNVGDRKVFGSTLGERERERHQDRCQRIHPGIGLKQCQVSPTRAVRDPIINCTVPDQTL